MNPSPLLTIQGDTFRADALVAITCPGNLAALEIQLNSSTKALEFNYASIAERDADRERILASWRSALNPSPSTPSGEGGPGGGVEELPALWRLQAKTAFSNHTAFGLRHCATQLEGRLANVREEKP